GAAGRRRIRGFAAGDGRSERRNHRGETEAKPGKGNWAEGMAGDVQLWRGDVPDCAGFDGRDDQAGGRVYVRSEAWRQERRGFEGDRNCGEGRVTGERSTVES